jgi:hypothetical protein
MAGLDDVAEAGSEGLAERKIVLVDEEPGRHGGAYAARDRCCSS